MGSSSSRPQLPPLGWTLAVWETAGSIHRALSAPEQDKPTPYTWAKAKQLAGAGPAVECSLPPVALGPARHCGNSHMPPSPVSTRCPHLGKPLPLLRLWPWWQCQLGGKACQGAAREAWAESSTSGEQVPSQTQPETRDKRWPLVYTGAFGTLLLLLCLKKSQGRRPPRRLTRA